MNRCYDDERKMTIQFLISLRLVPELLSDAAGSAGPTDGFLRICVECLRALVTASSVDQWPVLKFAASITGGVAAIIIRNELRLCLKTL